MLKRNVCILNTGSPTYFHPGTGSLSAIDLSLCHPSLYLDLSWSVHEDLCGSDHYPVVITTTQSYDHDALPSWKLDKADWCTFSEACSEELTIANIEDSSIGSFTEKLTAIAENTIPKSKPHKRTVNTVWCNSDCKEAIRHRRKAQKRAEISPTTENMEHFRFQRAKCRKTVRTSRRHSWQTFVSTVNSRTSLGKVWNVIGKISGKKSSTGSHHLSVNNNEITTIPDIANTLGHTFSNNSSTQHYSDRFNAHRLLAERHQLKFNSNNNEAYNSIFSMDELSKAITKSSDSAVGPDDIHYQMLKHLPKSALSTLLHIINKHWCRLSFYLATCTGVTNTKG